MKGNESQTSNGVINGCMLAFVMNGTVLIWFIIIPIFGVRYFPDITTSFWQLIRGSGVRHFPASWQYSLSVIITIAVLCIIFWFAIRPLMNFLIRKIDSDSAQQD